MTSNASNSNRNPHIFDWIQNYRGPYWGSPKLYRPKKNLRMDNTLLQKTMTLIYDKLYGGLDLDSLYDAEIKNLTRPKNVPPSENCFTTKLNYLGDLRKYVDLLKEKGGITILEELDELRSQ
ncbi:hypothetical protein OnM2_106010 [Erysiphe neolycopersici]|uniref:Uncharacterized protein n=1 Tax=Erysiphe neolycopersici TaxID=212602 RepID=A0A420H765_9PEZI|nr:hypothetical protein OnM2_106010 [Erysiphe neolycopersici]